MSLQIMNHSPEQQQQQHRELLRLLSATFTSQAIAASHGPVTVQIV